jgi:hypothetical protein
MLRAKILLNEFEYDALSAACEFVRGTLEGGLDPEPEEHFQEVHNGLTALLRRSRWRPDKKPKEQNDEN